MKMHGQTAHGDKPDFHGMLLVGGATAYLYHLPMFMSPHNFQAIFEVTLTAAGSNPMAVYLADRQATGTKMYSFTPQQNFVLTDLVSPTPSNPKLTSFTGTIVRGHFEDGHFEPKGDNLIVDVVAHVTNVVHFAKLDPAAQALPQLEYLMFGKAQEILLAHLLTRPPDFDQVVGVKVSGHAFTDQDLSQAITLSLPGRPNSPDSRIREQEQFTPQLLPGLSCQAGTEFYFETNDLAKSM